MVKIISIIILLFSFHLIYSQTEQAYFERLRVNRHNWKIKKIITADCTDYFDEDGYHIKREVIDNFNNTLNTYSITYLANGDLNVEIDLEPEGKFTIRGSQALFYHTYFDPYNLIDNVKMDIDDINRVKEEVYTGTDYQGSDYTKYYYEILKMYPNRSEFYNETKLVSITKYFYDGKGMLLKEEMIEVNTGKTQTNEYTYEYF
jgi:hypothetical protein